ncbi:MAG: serine/threonine-protein kinase [Acidobacteriia bacterium]|nr:serine/threonine-protein kinase [Terriglobia bacterium]
MPLSVGDKLGHYEVISLLGNGGMGEVYRARDTTLKRDVALKVLPATFLADPDRMARFQREAQVLASLDHPNIGPIYGIADSADSRGLVLALIEGPTLADRIAAGALPPEEAFHVAKQIIEALEYAHDRGVIHRDLKPANVKITPEGVVKVLDFGLAKVLEDEPPPSSLTNSPTLTVGHTRAGVILGTAAYMSPEQAVGRPVDRRSDIFSFGAVLYEMLTSKRAFTGAATPDVLEAVVKSDPDWAALPAGTPEPIWTLLRRCLTKDRKQRLQAIGEARIVLENPGSEAEASRGLKPAPQWGLVAALAAMTLITGVALWGWLKPMPPEPHLVTRFTTASQAKSPFPLPVLSRDGSRIAQTGGAAGISVRSLDEFETKLIPGTEGNITSPCFSPDGQWIVFSIAGGAQLKKVPVAGGAAVTLAEGLSNGSNCDWGEDDQIYFVVSQGILRVASSGGKPETIATPDAKKNENAYFFPQLLPGGKQLLFAVSSPQGVIQAATVNLQTKEKKILQGEGLAWYAPSGPDPSVGHLVFGRNGSLFAAPFDVKRLQEGSAVTVLEGVVNFGPIAMFGLSDSGTLAYVAGGATTTSSATLVWVDRQGAEQSIPTPPRNYNFAKLSPEGGRVAVSIQDLQTLDSDIWISDLARGSLERRTYGGSNSFPVWTPDGKRLVYWSSAGVGGFGPGALSTIPADGSGAPTSLLARDPPPYSPTSVSVDGKTLMGDRGGRDGNGVWVLPLAEGASVEAKPRYFLESKFNEQSAHFSPDSHWVAYTSNESGSNQIYVVPYPGPGGKSQVSLDGGTDARWNRNGRELFFRNGNKMMVVDVQTSPTFHAGTPKMLFETANIGFDVSPDGRRFLMVKPGAASQGQQTEMRVVLNWFEELRRRVPLPK